MFPAWAKHVTVDEYGNVACKKCGGIQSRDFIGCIFCCQHDELKLIEEWQGSDSGGTWGLNVECALCGKNFDFNNEKLMREYKLVLKIPTIKQENDDA
jgi:hypothetical protein